MTPERLEELRQVAGGVDGPKSDWMDELIEEIDRLRRESAAFTPELQDVAAERTRQDEKWEDTSHHRDTTWLAILTEEVGEVAKAILQCASCEELYSELVQVAAVAVAWMEAMRRRGY
jgi:NTP pyrophosphatase (non-canonical NTP hydrolase)